MKIDNKLSQHGLDERAVEQGGVAAIASDVSMADWTHLVYLASSFFKEFEISLMFLPVGSFSHGNIEVWFCVDNEDYSYSPKRLEAYEYFIKGWLGSQGLISKK